MISYLGKGLAHERSGMGCQDAVGGLCADNGSVIAVISDGAGRARYAAEAAQCTVEAVTGLFGRMPLAEFLEMPRDRQISMLLETCVTRLTEECTRLGEPDIRHFCATLLFAVVSPEQILVGHLGDGTAVVLDDGGQQLLHSHPAHGLQGSRTTYFTISPAAEHQLRLYCFDREQTSVDFLALTSDGPYEMLTNRGGGDPVETVRELWKLVRREGLDSEEGLADVLNQMAEIPFERMDDWSVVLWSAGGSGDGLPKLQQPRSMLREEQQKYGTAAPDGERNNDLTGDN